MVFFHAPGAKTKKALGERACPEELKSEVLARSKQYFVYPFQFYEMWIYGWISLVLIRVIG